MNIINIQDGAAKLKKTIRESGVKAYQDGLETAIINQADPVYMKAAIKKMNDQLNFSILGYFDNLNHRQ